MSTQSPIETKFDTSDLESPVTVNMVIGTDTGKGDNYQLLAVLFKAATNITETVTITVLRNEGNAVFIYLLDSTALSGAQTVVFTPTGFIALKSKDIVRVAITSATATGNGSTTIDVRKAD